MAIWLAAGAVAYAALVGGMYALQRQLLYFPDKATPMPAAWGVPDMAPRRVTTADGLDIVGWYRPAAESSRPTVVLFHGNAGHVGFRGFKARVFLDAGFGVLLAGYRGYGGNPGEPTEEGLYRDARAALDALAADGIHGPRLVLYGESLGTGVAVAMAGERPVGAVILEAPYTSIPDVGARHYPILPVKPLMKDRFDSLSRIGSITAPLLIVHGEGDTVVPVEFGRALFAAAPDRKTGAFLRHAGHNDLYAHGAADVVLDFLDRELPR